ncbi:alpha/beta fold hydrolase [Aquimarina sp. M1]
MVLFHQAKWNRGENIKIAPKLTELGYNCLAVDQLSGLLINERLNHTAKAAEKSVKQTNYVDVYQDVKAAIAFVKKTYNPEKVIIWGSSYSSSLVLKYAVDRSDVVQGVFSFSPEEYFKQKDYITTSASNIRIPVFLRLQKMKRRVG